MKSDLLDCFAHEVVTMLSQNRSRHLADSQAHLIQTERSSSSRPLIAVRILVRVVAKLPQEPLPQVRLPQHLSRPTRDTERMILNEKSIAAHRSNNSTQNYSKYLPAADLRPPTFMTVLRGPCSRPPRPVRRILTYSRQWVA